MYKRQLCNYLWTCKCLALPDSNICKRSQILKIRPLDLNTPRLRVFCHAWDRTCQDIVYSCTKFDVCNYTYSRFTEGGLKLKNVTLTLTRPLVVYFVTREMGLAKIYQYTKFEVSSFTRSKFTEGGLKFNFLVSGRWPRPFKGYFVMLMYLPRSIIVLNLTFLALPVPNIGKGFSNLKIQPWTPTTPIFGVFCHAWYGTCQGLSVYWIWSF